MGSTQNEKYRAIEDCIQELEQERYICEVAFESEHPQHTVQMDAFYLDKHEVANSLFQRFVQQTGYQTTAEREGSAKTVEGGGSRDVKGASWRKPEASMTVFDSGRSGHPVVSVSWDDAQAYCRWAGKRLPTEAEFEYALRAGSTTRYWWGNGSPGARRVENIADESAKYTVPNIMKGYDDGFVRTAPVGSCEANPWGLYDMGGNVWEWVADWYVDDYYGKSPLRNPRGPSDGLQRILRGGAWGLGPVVVRSALRGRNMPEFRLDLIGFRCAQDIPK